MINNKLKVGDIVKPFDGSYTMSIKDTVLEATYGIDINYEEWKILALNCKVPASDVTNDNDTIIQSATGRVVFIKERFLNFIRKSQRS